MFGNEQELTKAIPRNLIIDLVGSNHLHEMIISNCFDVNEGEYAGRIKIISLNSIDLLPLRNKDNFEKEATLGLLNMNWIKKMTETRPSTIILIYDLKNKAEGITWKDYELNIYSDIIKIRKTDNFPYLNIVLFIFSNINSFTFDNVSEDKEREYSIKRLLENKNLYYIYGNDYLKTNAKKLANNIIKLSINYYRSLKKDLKIKKNNAGDNKQKQVKYSIKLGVISLIKNKRKTWKYLDEAYNILFEMVNKFDYTNTNIRNNYLEIKAVSDWLIYKISGLRLTENYDIQLIASNLYYHIINFSKLSLYSENDPFIFIEYYWKMTRYLYLAKLLKDYNKNEITIKSIPFQYGFYYMMSAINIIRAIKILKKENKNLIDKKGNESSINSIKLKQSKFFGKIPKSTIKVDPLTDKIVDFDDNVYFKQFLILNNNLTPDTLKEQLFKDLDNVREFYSNSFLKEKDKNSMFIYFNTLIIESEGLLNLTQQKNVYKLILNSLNLKKFSQLYLKYVNAYNKLLVDLNNDEDNEAILFNISNIASLRSLTNSEEEYNKLHNILGCSLKLLMIPLILIKK